MTHANTIATLIRLRGASLNDAANAHQTCNEYTEHAAMKAAEVRTELAQAADYSRLLRDLDPMHAENYPDPDPAGPGTGAAHPLVLALHHLADRLAEQEIPAWHNSAKIEVTLHGVAESIGREFAAEYARDPDAVTEDGRDSSRWLSVKHEYDEEPGSPNAIAVELTVFVDPTPQSEETELAQAGPAVAE